MKIYRLIADLEHYGQLEFDCMALLASLGSKRFTDMKNPTLAWEAHWPKLPGEFCEYGDCPLECGMPDLSIWKNSGLVLSTKALNVLKRSIAAYGELLPFQCSNEDYWLFRCTKSIPADKENSHKMVEDGLDIEIQQLNFTSSEVGSTSLFSTDYDHHRNLFCNEWFRSIAVKQKLTGVDFVEKLGTSIF